MVGGQEDHHDVISEECVKETLGSNSTSYRASCFLTSFIIQASHLSLLGTLRLCRFLTQTLLIVALGTTRSSAYPGTGIAVHNSDSIPLLEMSKPNLSEMYDM